MLRARPNNLPWWIELVVAASLTLLGTIYVEYTKNDRLDAERLTIVETKVKSQDEKVDHIQSQVDKIYDKLLDWEKK
jgi:hypothetical protein